MSKERKAANAIHLYESFLAGQVPVTPEQLQRGHERGHVAR